jgi:hypothetical protein
MSGIIPVVSGMVSVMPVQFRWEESYRQSKTRPGNLVLLYMTRGSVGAFTDSQHFLQQIAKRF